MPEPFRVAASTVFVDLLETFAHEEPLEMVLRAGATSVLRHQIEAGLDVDLFVSADFDDAAAIARIHRFRAGAVRFASNRVVLAVRADSPIRSLPTSPEAWTTLLLRIAIGRPESTASGRAARAALMRSGAWKPLGGNLVFSGTVRQALALASTGDADAAIVFQTDVIASGGKTRVVCPLPNCPAVPAGYVLLTPDSPDGRTWSRALSSRRFRALLQRQGFGKP
ncbi:MAG: molybdate ABC transporter substrate-binding protein [Armatimonadota bacterium]